MNNIYLSLVVIALTACGDPDKAPTTTKRTPDTKSLPATAKPEGEPSKTLPAKVAPISVAPDKTEKQTKKQPDKQVEGFAGTYKSCGEIPADELETAGTAVRAGEFFQFEENGQITVKHMLYQDGDCTEEIGEREEIVGTYKLGKTGDEIVQIDFEFGDLKVYTLIQAHVGIMFLGKTCEADDLNDPSTGCKQLIGNSAENRSTEMDHETFYVFQL